MVIFPLPEMDPEENGEKELDAWQRIDVKYLPKFSRLNSNYFACIPCQDLAELR